MALYTSSWCFATTHVGVFGFITEPRTGRTLSSVTSRFTKILSSMLFVSTAPTLARQVPKNQSRTSPGWRTSTYHLQGQYLTKLQQHVPILHLYQVSISILWIKSTNWDVSKWERFDFDIRFLVLIRCVDYFKTFRDDDVSSHTVSVSVQRWW